MKFFENPDKLGITGGWKLLFEEEFSKEYFIRLDSFLSECKADGICPVRENIFRAFEFCRLEDVRVVIIGQDPYCQSGKADGLCFSYNNQWKRPTTRRDSLDNILLEVRHEGFSVEQGQTSLEKWARQGVLLLNTVLTVDRDGKSGSHEGKGWESFTDAVIRAVNLRETPCVFILWGSRAQIKTELIDKTKHLCLTGAHPCPMSAKGFLYRDYFVNANNFLGKKREIDWALD